MAVNLSALLGQEHRDVPDEALRVLVLRTVVGVRVDDQLSVGDVLLQNPRVDGVDDHVVVAVDYQRRLQYGLEVLIGTPTLHAPFADGLDLGGRHFLVHLGIAVFSAAEEALQEFAAGGLAGFRVGEVDLQPELLRHLVGGAENLLRFRRESGHVLAAARAGADEHQAPHQIGGLQRDLLGDEAADREAEHINFLQSQRLDECDGVGAHFLERGRHLARAAGYARVVEQDYFSILGQAVDHGRVPMVHGTGEVLVENQRHTADRAVEFGPILRIDTVEEQFRVEVRSLAEAAVGETDAVGFDKLRRSGLVTMLGHWDSFGRWRSVVGAVAAVDVEDMAGDE